jgi:hypothetical protein
MYRYPHRSIFSNTETRLRALVQALMDKEKAVTLKMLEGHAPLPSECEKMRSKRSRASRLKLQDRSETHLLNVLGFAPKARGAMERVGFTKGGEGEAVSEGGETPRLPKGREEWAKDPKRDLVGQEGQ